MITNLDNKHSGEFAFIVGKGPSLAKLNASHFKQGPIITMNSAIVTVAALGLRNPTYSLQKDGCKDGEPRDCKTCNGDRFPMLYVNSEITVITTRNRDFSGSCLKKQRHLYRINPVRELGLDKQSVMSIRMATTLARRMGCSKIFYLCCDSFVNGNIETYDYRSGGSAKILNGNNYRWVIPVLLKELGDFPHEFITPV